jgi:hypothetical protein
VGKHLFIIQTGSTCSNSLTWGGEKLCQAPTSNLSKTRIKWKLKSTERNYTLEEISLQEKPIQMRRLWNLDTTSEWLVWDYTNKFYLSDNNVFQWYLSKSFEYYRILERRYIVNKPYDSCHKWLKRPVRNNISIWEGSAFRRTNKGTQHLHRFEASSWVYWLSTLIGWYFKYSPVPWNEGKHAACIYLENLFSLLNTFGDRVRKRRERRIKLYTDTLSIYNLACLLKKQIAPTYSSRNHFCLHNLLCQESWLRMI